MKEQSLVRPNPILIKLGAAVAALAALALGGCAHVPADTLVQAQPDFAHAQHAASIQLARDAWPDARWWTAYHDDQLDALIKRALKDSPTLASAAARIGSARAALAFERTAGGFQAGLDVGANRQRYSGNGLFPEPIGGNFFNDVSVQVKAGYDLDWWGKHRATVAAALGESNARQADFRQAERALAVAVAQSYFRLQLLWARLDNVQAMTALQRDVVLEKSARIAHGLANIDEQRDAERDLGTLGEQAAALASQAGREREALRALVGANAGEPAQIVDQLARRPLASASIASLPTQLGFELLARRPDLQAARWRVEASLGRVAASRAAYYPDINLASAIGLDSVSLARLLRPDSLTVLLGSAVQLPLFDSARLDANLSLARAQRNEMIADYNALVARAVGEVAAEGATVQGLQRQAQAQAATQQASAALLASATRRVKQGLADRAAPLQAKLAMLRQEDVRLQLRDAALQGELALTRALGGGFQAATATAAATPAIAAATPGPMPTTKKQP
jgi:multidrug efflux system outer membrane protein